MKQTSVQINGMMANFWHANSTEKRMDCDDDNELASCAFLSLTKKHGVAPTGHEGHVMPMPAKPPVSKPANEKVKPKGSPPPPAAKPPAKRADRFLRLK